MTKKVLTSYQAAAYCNATPMTVIRWINEGLIRSYKTPGGHRRILVEDLDAFLKKSGIPSKGIYDDQISRILVVDDEAFIIDYLKETISKIDPNIQVKGACNGFEAGQIITTFKPQVVFLDIIMKGLDGYDVCTRIKKNPETKDITVIAITGKPSEENIERIKSCGACQVLHKPIKMNDIRRALIDLIPVNGFEEEEQSKF